MKAGAMRPHLLALVLAAGLAGCGGGDPFDNPSAVANSAGQSGQKLSFAYFQYCVNPIFLAQLQVNHSGTISISTCAGGGCHDNTTGTGGAFRVIASATAVDLTNAANTPDVVRATDMYKNYYSAQGEAVLSDVMQSRLITKPMVLGVLHGGGLIFDSASDPNVKRFIYWISHPMPQGQDEFSSAASTLFSNVSNNDLSTGTCNTD